MVLALRFVALILAVGLWILGVLRWVDGDDVVGAVLILAGALVGVGALVARRDRGDSLIETVLGFFQSLP